MLDPWTTAAVLPRPPSLSCATVRAWRTRVAIRLHDHAPSPDGSDAYTNRAVAFLELRWGRLRVWEDYEDTERTADWDALRALAGSDF